MVSNSFKKTIKTYRQLGKQYIANVASINLPSLPKFMKVLPKGGKVLDVGCAGGRDSRKFVANGFSVVGIDAVDIFISEAKKRVPQADFIKTDVLKLDFPRNTFDGIWAQAVLLHLERKDVPTVLAKFYVILKSGGKIHVAVKEGEGQGWDCDKLANDKKRFFTYFSQKEMRNLFKKAGFKIILSKLVDDDAGREKIKWVVIWGEKA